MYGELLSPQHICPILNLKKNNSQSKTPETETEDLRHEKEKKANSDLTFDVIIGNFAFV